MALALLSVLGVAATASAQPKGGSGLCLKVKDNPVLVEVDRGKVEYCFDQGKSLSCYATDLLDGSLWVNAASSHVREPDGYPMIPLPASQPTVDVKDTEVEVCQPNSTECKTFKPKDAVDPGLGLTASVNTNGTLLGLTNGAWVEVHDTKSGKRLSRFKAGKNNYACSYVGFAGDALVVEHYDCGDAKQSDTYLATKTGKRLGVLGGKLPIGMTTNPVRLDDKRYAFAASGGDAVAIHDVKSGKLIERIQVGPPADANPILAYGIDSDDNEKLALVFQESRVGEVVTIDFATDKVTSYAPKRCK